MRHLDVDRVEVFLFLAFLAGESEKAQRQKQAGQGMPRTVAETLFGERTESSVGLPGERGWECGRSDLPIMAGSCPNATIPDAFSDEMPCGGGRGEGDKPDAPACFQSSRNNERIALACADANAKTLLKSLFKRTISPSRFSASSRALLAYAIASLMIGASSAISLHRPIGRRVDDRVGIDAEQVVQRPAEALDLVELVGHLLAALVGGADDVAAP